MAGAGGRPRPLAVVPLVLVLLLDLRSQRKSGFVLSALSDGPLLFATC